MRKKRENWKGKYYIVTRDEKGRFVSWKKWTWKKEEEEEAPPSGRWVKVTVFYEGKDRGSYHVDCGIVRWNGDVESMKATIKKRVMEKLKWYSWVEIENSLGLRVGVGFERDGETEDWYEVWRV